MNLLLARGRDRLETKTLVSDLFAVLVLLLARGRDQLETLKNQSTLADTAYHPLLARGRDRLETYR